MISVCWFRAGDDKEWTKGILWFLETGGALVTAEGDGKLVRVTIGNLWIHQNAPTHSQFG